MKLPDIEIVSAAVHAAWIQSKLAQGVTTRRAEDGEELMVPYSELSEKAKELDRATVRAVYRAIESVAPFDSEFLTRVRNYIERCEVQIDGEWGECRTLGELKADGVMPDIYGEVLQRLGEVLQRLDPPDDPTARMHG